MTLDCFPTVLFYFLYPVKTDIISTQHHSYTQAATGSMARYDHKQYTFYIGLIINVTLEKFDTTAMMALELLYLLAPWSNIAITT